MALSRSLPMTDGARQEAAVFCDREYVRLVAVLGVRCGDQRVAEEIAQEALARACARWDHVRGLDDPRAWVYRVALNLASSRFRRLAIERKALRRVGSDAGRGPDGPPDAEQFAVRQAVMALPPRQRTVLALRFYVGMSVIETAEVLGTTAGSVKGHTTRALKALRPRLVDADAPEERIV